MNRMVYCRDTPDAGCSSGHDVRRPATFAHSIEQMLSERNHFDAGQLHPKMEPKDNGVLNSTSTTRPTTLHFTWRDNREFTKITLNVTSRPFPDELSKFYLQLKHSSVML